MTIRRSLAFLYAGLLLALLACSGTLEAEGGGTLNNGGGDGVAGNGDSGDGGGDTGGGGNGGGGGDSGDGDGDDPASGGRVNVLNPSGEEILPFEAQPRAAALRKVKNLLIGHPPTEVELAAVLAAKEHSDVQDLLRGLIDDWMETPEFEGKMLVFFRNAFQQVGFTPEEDFKLQLLENAGFDLGPIGAFGDDGFTRLVKNLEESFARTAIALMKEGAPFIEVLTTRRYMMTTALMSLYTQIEMPNDQPFNFAGSGPSCTTDADCTTPGFTCASGAFGGNRCRLTWKIDYSGEAIPIEESLACLSDWDNRDAYPNCMVFDDVAPVSGEASIGGGFNSCRGTGAPGGVAAAGQVVTMSGGYSTLFQRLFGFTPRYPYAGTFDCVEHPSRPYYTPSDLSDWRMVTLSSGRPSLAPFDLPALRQANSLSLALPRLGFYTTPAFLALWNTNDSNQHRVTANQTLLVALGTGFTREAEISPVSEVGLDDAHSAAAPECYGCHKSLDPMRQFFDTQFDYNDRNDFQSGFSGNPRPNTTGGVFAFLSVNEPGSDLFDFGTLLRQVTSGGLNRFGFAMAQHLCYWANSTGCWFSDPEYHRVVSAFEGSGFDFKTLVRELMSSPLVTALDHVATFEQRNVVISVSRRDHLCGALSNRLDITDLCAQAYAFPYAGFGGGAVSSQNARVAAYRISGAIAADAFGRGTEVPITPSSPTLFYSAASELLCEHVAARAVDAEGGLYTSSDATAAIADMVSTLMGLAPGDAQHQGALEILTEHFNQASAASNATQALRSTFALACQAPTSVGVGL